MSGFDPIDERLSQLGRATRGIRARAGFADAVMLAVAAEQAPSFELLLVKSVRRFVPLGLVAAVLSLAWAVVSEQSTDAAFAAADDTVEIEW